MNDIEMSLAILVSIAKSQKEYEETNNSLNELSRLLDTAGGKEFARMIQIKESFDVRTCIGSGKIQELKELCEANEIDLIIFDFELSPAQIRNIEEDLGNDVRVLDRSMLILDIFALHAVTSEGKLQVELAQLKYTAPRLTGHGKDLSRLGGGIGTRGPGESKLESDKRHLHERIHTLEVQLEDLKRTRTTIRSARQRSSIPQIAIVGYTNAGKSTLLNALTDAGVLSQDQLFATLDPTTRKMELPSGQAVYLTDTVGFIRKLPHHLIHAFHSTLEEVTFCDLVLILSDINDPECEEHIQVTEDLLKELQAEEKPRLYVYNKCDSLDHFGKEGVIQEGKVYISAKEGTGLNLLLQAITDELQKNTKLVKLQIPYQAYQKLSALHDEALEIKSTEYLDSFVEIQAVLDARLCGKYKEFIIDGLV